MSTHRLFIRKNEIEHVLVAVLERAHSLSSKKLRNSEINFLPLFMIGVFYVFVSTKILKHCEIDIFEVPTYLLMGTRNLII